MSQPRGTGYSVESQFQFCRAEFRERVQFMRDLLAVSLHFASLKSQSLGESLTWKWSQWSGLNRRPTVYETVALPLSYIGFQQLATLCILLVSTPES
jgi:hypothetical protein